MKRRHENGLVRTKEHFAKALRKRQREAEENEEIAEEVARQASNHIAVLARFREQVPQKAQEGIDQAITESAKARENALLTLEQMNLELSNAVAEATLQEVLARVPETAQERLQRALEDVKADVKPKGVRVAESAEAHEKIKHERVLDARHRETPHTV